MNRVRSYCSVKTSVGSLGRVFVVGAAFLSVPLASATLASSAGQTLVYLKTELRELRSVMNARVICSQSRQGDKIVTKSCPVGYVCAPGDGCDPGPDMLRRLEAERAARETAASLERESKEREELRKPVARYARLALTEAALITQLGAGAVVVAGAERILQERLNSREKQLFDENPLVAARVFYQAGEAYERTKEFYQSSPEVRGNGNGGAFRHVYWNFLMARDPLLSTTWIDRWASAHEEGAVRQPPLEKSMDYFNNQVGRHLAAEVTDSDPRHVLNAIRSGRARIIVGNQLVSSNSVGEK